MKIRGMSLLEAAMSAGLLALLILGVLSVYPLSVLTVGRCEGTLEADQLAQTTLDDAQSQPFSELQPGAPVDLPGQSLRGLDYHPSLQIFLVPGADPQLLKGLRARVWWDERGRRREVLHELWIQGLPR